MSRPAIHDADIAELTRAGLGVKQIATRLEISPTTVNRGRARLGLQTRAYRPPTDPAILARAKQFLEEGCTYREAAESVGVHHNTLQQRLPGYGMSRADAARVGLLTRQARQVLR